MKAITHLFLMVSLLVLASSALADAQPVEQATACYAVTGNAVFIVNAYNHVVTVKNDCGKALQCQVWTSVDPEPKIPISVGSGKSESVTTRRGSPASAFKAYGECK